MKVGIWEPKHTAELQLILQEIGENELTVEIINREIGWLLHVIAHCLISNGNNNYQA